MASQEGRERRAAAGVPRAVFQLALAAYLALSAWLVWRSAVLQPYSDMLDWLARYLRFRSDGDLAGYLLLGDLGVFAVLPWLFAGRNGAADRPGVARPGVVQRELEDLDVLAAQAADFADQLLIRAHALMHPITVEPDVTWIAGGQATGFVHPAAMHPVELILSFVLPCVMLMYIGRFDPSTMLTS